MTSIDIDTDLQEQSKLLLRKLKERQGKLQHIVTSTNVSNVSSDTSIKRCWDTDLDKSIGSSWERSAAKRQLGIRQLKSDKEQSNYDKLREDKENVPETHVKGSIGSKDFEELRESYRERLGSDDSFQDSERYSKEMNSETYRKASELESLRREIESEEKHLKEAGDYSDTYLKDLGAEIQQKEPQPEEIETKKKSIFEDSFSSNTYVKKGIETPNTVRRRKIIDKNVRVDHNLNDTEVLGDCDEDFPRLNFSYTNFEENDLKYLQSRLEGRVSPEAVEKPEKTKSKKSSVVKSKTVKLTPKRTDKSPKRVDKSPKRRDKSPASPKRRDKSPARIEKDKKRQDKTLKQGFGPSEEGFEDKLENPGNSRKLAKFIRDTEKPKSILLSRTGDKSNRSISKVSFQSSKNNSSLPVNQTIGTQGRYLGYDWIAALLDNESGSMNQSETFFEDLREFRRVNRDECVNHAYMEGPQYLWEHPEKEASPVAKALADTKVKPYQVNDRLFTEPIKRSLFADFEVDDEAEKPWKKEMEPTYEEPRFVRVSIPRSTLQSPHRVRPHRRRSFDPTDSCALSQHCLMGWDTSRPTMLPSASNVGLRESSLGMKSYMKTTLHDAEKLAANYPYPWDPEQQTISRPMPKQPPHIPSTSYLDNTVNSRPNLSQYGETGTSASLKQATDDLLNSTYSLMFEMEKLKKERDNTRY